MVEKIFPNLRISGYLITSPATAEYNCIAWAAGDTERCWWPDNNNVGYWPFGVERKETLDAFVKTYETLGFTICQNSNYEFGFEKIAVYVDAGGKPTHAARQLNSGHWTSKLGQLVDIEHNTLGGLENSQYGVVAVFMKRPK